MRENKQPPNVHLWTIITLALLSPWEGFAIAKLWGWFAVPIGAPVISWAVACGLSVLSGTLLSGKAARKVDDEGWEYAVSAVTTPAMALLLGWLFHCAEVSHFLR